MGKIHTVRKPFMCRPGQFGDERQLVVGIAVDALVDNEYKFKIGKNPKVYVGIREDILVNAHIWTNSKGKKVAIIPVAMFEIEESVEEKESINNA